MRTILRPVVVLLALALAATGLLACGGSGGAGNESVSALLTDTFNGGKQIKSGKLDVSLNLDTKGLKGVQGPLALKLTGPFQSQGEDKLPEFALKLALSASGQSFTAGATSTGDKGFVSFQGTNYSVSPQLFDSFKQGFLQAQKSSGSKKGALGLGELGIDPRRWLTNPRKAGTADIGGAKTVHLTAGIDVPKLLDDLDKVLAKAGQLGVTSRTAVPSKLTATQKRQIARSVKSARVDIYTGEDDKILRKLALDVVLDVPKDVQSRAGGLQSGTVSFAMTFADLNESQDITAPANAKPLSDLLAQLGGLTGLGGAPGSGSSGSGSGAAGANGASGESLQKYSACLQGAGNDLAKAQKCAALLK